MSACVALPEGVDRKGLLGGKRGLRAGPMARTTIRAYFVPVDVSTVKNPWGDSSFGCSYSMALTSAFSTTLEMPYLSAISRQ